MAIAGSLIKGATKVVGKAINVAKKKKKDLDTKGRRVKKKLVNKELDKAEVSSNPIEAGDKANKSIKRIINTPDAVVGAGATATQVGKKAVKATKETISKATRSPAGIAATESLKDIDKATGGFVSGRNIAAVAGVAGALGLGQSLLKSNAKPEQEYTTKRLPDGRFSTTFGGNNANVVFANKQLSEKEINEVRTQLAVLDSIIDSSDPKSRRKEFTETVEMLSKKYGISNITGKNLSVLIPMSK
tara:strand:- start:775 stop:1509 length:735 start_codon:yes stop_codon:yes gene_type:complete